MLPLLYLVREITRKLHREPCLEKWYVNLNSTHCWAELQAVFLWAVAAWYMTRVESGVVPTLASWLALWPNCDTSKRPAKPRR